MNTISRYLARPNCPTEQFKNLDDLLQIDWVAIWLDKEGFSRFCITINQSPFLVVEFNDGSFWVVGSCQNNEGLGDRDTWATRAIVPTMLSLACPPHHPFYTDEGWLDEFYGDDNEYLSEAEMDLIEQSKQDIEAGRVVSHEQIKQELEANS